MTSTKYTVKASLQAAAFNKLFTAWFDEKTKIYDQNFNEFELFIYLLLLFSHKQNRLILHWWLKKLGIGFLLFRETMWWTANKSGSTDLDFELKLEL